MTSRIVKIQETTIRLPGAVTALANRGSLDIGQVMAANRFLHNWEIMRAPGLRSPDLSRVSARTNGKSDSLSQSYTKACQEMRQAEALLGKAEHGFALVVAALAEGKSLGMLGRNQTEKRYAAHQLRLHLDALALLWGLKARR